MGERRLETAWQISTGRWIASYSTSVSLGGLLGWTQRCGFHITTTAYGWELISKKTTITRKNIYWCLVQDKYHLHNIHKLRISNWKE